MSTKLNRASYDTLIAEDLAWLAKQPRTLEREHIRMIVEASAAHEYGDAQCELEGLRKVVRERDRIDAKLDRLNNSKAHK